MKVIVVPILILLMATQAFSKWVILLEFNRNRDYIAKNLCENRSKPKLKCGGKCQLAKAMEKTEDSPTSSQPSKTNFTEVLFVPLQLTDQTGHVEELASAPWPPFMTPRYTAPPVSIFHPPV